MSEQINIHKLAETGEGENLEFKRNFNNETIETLDFYPDPNHDLNDISIEKNKELHIIPGVGHCPAIESPQKLTELLVPFFKKERISN
jgi:hypothetical protein